MQADTRNRFIRLLLYFFLCTFAAVPTGTYADEDIFFGAENIHPSECEAKGLSLMYPMRPYCIMLEKVNCF